MSITMTIGVRIGRTLGALGSALAVTTALTACATSGGPSAISTGGGGFPSGPCPLVGAPDPGNSTAQGDPSGGGGAPKVTRQGAAYEVAFSQNSSDNPWRVAETKSFEDEAARRGWKLTVRDANGDQAKQIQDIKGLIDSRPDALFIAPITEQLGSVVVAARNKGIPVFLVDRDVDHAVARPGVDFVSVMTSDFVREGERAAWAMANATGGNARIIELEGTAGASPAIDRKKGFDAAIKACPGMQVVVSQAAGFNRDKGREVTETLLQSHPEATAVYAHNDEMALGAVAALKAAGRTPGQDVKLVSIDGEKDALTAIQRGELHTSVECSPRFGRVAFDTMEKYASGKDTPVALINKDRLFDSRNAEAEFESAF